MSIRYWIAAIAFGLTLVGPALGQSQQEAQSEQGRAKAQEQPPQALPIPLPVEVAPPLQVEIIEDKEAAESRERREAESSQREKDDLVAQQGMNAATQAMNEATQRMAEYARWSTVLVGIGTALLIWTLFLTRQANHAAVASVDVTQKIGEAQTRAYLHCISAQYILETDSISAILDIENIGNSPASEVKLVGDVTIHDVAGFPERTRVTRWVSAKKEAHECQPIVTKGRITERFYFSWEYNFLTNIEDADDIAFRREVFDTGNEAWFDIRIEYMDVFGKRSLVPLSLESVIGPHPLNPKKKRTRRGKLNIHVEDGRIHTARAYQPADD